MAQGLITVVRLVSGLRFVTYIRLVILRLELKVQHLQFRDSFSGSWIL